MNQPLVSVVIPTVGSSTLRAAIDSVRNQTHSDLEVVVVYNGPAESFNPARMKEAMAGVPGRMVTAIGVKSGSVARNAGVKAAHGTLVALLDDDDIWEVDKLEKQLASTRLAAGHRWVSATRAATFGEGRERIYPSDAPEGDDLVRFLLSKPARSLRGANFIQTSTLLARREFFLECPFDESLAIHQDLDWLLTVSRFLDFELIFQPEVLVKYRNNAGSVSRSGRYAKSLEWIDRKVGDDYSREKGDFVLTVSLDSATRPFSIRGVRACFSAAARYSVSRPILWLRAPVVVAVRAATSFLRVLTSRPRQGRAYKGGGERSIVSNPRYPRS